MTDGENRAWCCAVCGFVHRGPAPPDACSVCGAPASAFEELPSEPAPAAAPTAAADRWRCLNCSYVHAGPAPTDACPVCGSPPDRFEPLADESAPADAGGFTGHLLVVGAGIAGVSAVEAFRETTSGGTVTLLGKESELPYYRLNLTRYLAGEIGADGLPIHPETWYAERNVDLALGEEVVSIDAAARSVGLHGGATRAYDRLVLAAGSHPFVPPIVGAQREGVTSLRTRADAERILATLEDGKPCVVIGGGLLGLETAGALAARGARVTLLEGHEYLMPRQLNRQAAEILRGHVEGIGVTVRREARTREILGDERAAGVLLDDDTRLDADLVVLATGVRPNSHLARRLGLEVNQGIVVDNRLVTSAPELLAAGDVAEHRGVLHGSWAAAQFQGRIAGLIAADAPAEFGGIPRSQSLKVLGLDLLSLGMFAPEDGSYLVLEAEEDLGYYRFVFRDARLVGAVLVGDTSFSGSLKKALEEGTEFSRELRQGISAGAFADHLRPAAPDVAQKT